MRWSGSIEREWTTALLRERPSLRSQAVMATALKMKQALPDAAVVDFELLESAFPKTDTKDRPVAAAAARCAPCSLVTWNKRDFNENELAAHAVDLTDPDAFLCRLFDADAALVVAATRRAFGFLRRPEGRPSWVEYLDLLGTKNQLKRFSECVRTFSFENHPIDTAENDPSS